MYLQCVWLCCGCCAVCTARWGEWFGTAFHAHSGVASGNVCMLRIVGLIAGANPHWIDIEYRTVPLLRAHNAQSNSACIVCVWLCVFVCVCGLSGTAALLCRKDKLCEWCVMFAKADYRIALLVLVSFCDLFYSCIAILKYIHRAAQHIHLDADISCSLFIVAFYGVHWFHLWQYFTHSANTVWADNVSQMLEGLLPPIPPSPTPPIVSERIAALGIVWSNDTPNRTQMLMHRRRMNDRNVGTNFCTYPGLNEIMNLMVEWLET